MKYTAYEIQNWNSSTEPTKPYHKSWIPARPVGYQGIFGLTERFKNAWGVLTGKYDALDWEQ